MPHEPTENQKNHFKVSCFILYNNKPFLNQIVMCDEKWILHDNQWWPNQWLDWEEAPKHFPKQTCTKKNSWSLFGDPLQLSEAWWNHWIWEVCSANWCEALETATPAASIGQQNGPSSSQHPTTCCKTLQMLNKLGYKVLPYPPCSPDLLPTDYHFIWASWELFAGKMLPQPAGGRKCFHNHQEEENALQEFVESQSTDFYATGINMHFLLAKMCWM